MSKNKPAFYIVLVTEILTTLLMSVGVFPREAALFLTGLLIFYFIFSRVEDSLILFIVSIPLFVALPITDNFDSMANWRILLSVLFLVWFFKSGWKIRGFNPFVAHSLGNENKLSFLSLISQIKSIVKQLLKSRLFILVTIFLFIGVLSLINAVSLTTAIKKLLFLINIFLLCPIVVGVAKKRRMVLNIVKAGIWAGFISLMVSYSQLVSVFLKPLFTFWQWWAKNVIPVFYGKALGELLSVSNTWFSYYPESPPTLRMFSLFPDSHSFALFTIIGLIFLTSLLAFKKLDSLKNLAKKFIWLIIIFSFFALIFSGSRGVWVSAVPLFLIVIILFIYSFFKSKKYSPFINQNSHLIRTFIGFLLIFLIAFPISSLILSQSYQDGDVLLAFKRAKSVTDIEELSVRSRIEIWKNSFSSIRKHPLLGVGIGNYPVVLGKDVSAAKKGASAHNLYLDIASEIGILGLIVLLLIFLEILRRSSKRLERSNRFSRIFAFVFFLYFIWILGYNLFDVVLFNDKVLLFFTAAVGMLYAVKNGKEIIASSLDK